VLSLFVRAIGFSVLFGIGGMIIGAIGASIFAADTSMPTREGGPGFFAMAIGIFAGFGGAIAGFIYALASRGVPVNRIGIGAVVVAATIALSFLTFRFFYTRSQAYLTDHYGSVPMQFEIQVPGGGAAIATEGIAVSLDEGNSEAQAATLTATHPSEDQGGKQVITGQVYLWRVTSKRSLRLELPGGGQSRTFKVDLPAFPVSERKLRESKWSAWTSNPEDPGYRIRYRVTDR
jgi:hypothetical protein